MTEQEDRRIYVCTKCGHVNSDWWRDRDNACEVCEGATEYFVPASQLHEARTQLEEAERDTTGALALVDRHRQRAESAEAQLKELLAEIEQLRKGERHPEHLYRLAARSALTHSTPPSDG